MVDEFVFPVSIALMIDDPGCKVCQHYIMGLSLFIVTMNWDQ